MANELEIIAENAAGDGWVDGVPGAVSTGYQAQNTALQALFNGVDKSSCSISGANLVIAAGGLIDDSGLPFVITKEITLARPTTGAENWFLRVVPGSTALERSIEFTDDRGTYDAAKNGFYDGDGYRVLNWCYSYIAGSLYRISDTQINIGQVSAFPYDNGFLQKSDTAYLEWIASRQKSNLDLLSGIWRAIAYNPITQAFVGIWFNGSTYRVYHITDRRGTMGSYFTLSAQRVSIEVDPATGNILLGDGTTLYVHSGFSNTVLTSFAANTDDICLDNDGNLIGLDTSTTIKRYNGITSSVIGTITVATDFDFTGVTGCAWDSRRGNLIINRDSCLLVFCNGFTKYTLMQQDAGSDLGIDIHRGYTYDQNTDTLYSIDNNSEIQQHGYNRVI